MHSFFTDALSCFGGYIFVDKVFKEAALQNEGEN